MTALNIHSLWKGVSFVLWLTAALGLDIQKGKVSKKTKKLLQYEIYNWLVFNSLQ